jgi:hypothetical protein
VINYPVPIIEALACHEILRKLGFPPIDILIAPDQLPVVVVVARWANGEKLLGFKCGTWEDTPEAFTPAWSAAIKDWNANCTDPNSGWDLAFRTSMIRRNAVTGVLLPLVTEGFHPRGSL